jgi:spoIIIJ-associated protein
MTDIPDIVHLDEDIEDINVEPKTKSVKKEDLEAEGDIAADYLEGLLDILDRDGDIDMDVENSRARVSVVGDDLEDLVGADGEVLDALQELTRLAVTRETDGRSRLMLDIAGFREKARIALIALAEEVAERVKASGEPEKLDPMNAFERKVVHDQIGELGLRSESEGEEPRRRIVVHPVD